MSKEENIELIKAECATQGLTLPEQVAYVLATVDWETGHTFQPVREAFYVSKDFDVAEAWRKKHLRYYPYYGRGYVQLTWKGNYQTYARITGKDLVNHPDLAMESGTSAFILVHGFKHGTFTGKKITDYIDSDGYDFIDARRCINGTDKAETIAALADRYLKEMGYEPA